MPSKIEAAVQVVLKREGLGQNQLARKIGASPSSFAEWLHLRPHSVPVLYAVKLWEQFGIHPKLWTQSGAKRA